MLPQQYIHLQHPALPLSYRGTIIKSAKSKVKNATVKKAYERK